LPTYTGISGATNDDGFNENRVSRCCRSDGQISAGGTLIPMQNISSRQVTDGLANTLLVGEQSDSRIPTRGSQWLLSSLLSGWLGGTYAIGVPPNYGSWLVPSYNLATLRYGLNEHRYDLPGVYLDHGANNPLFIAAYRHRKSAILRRFGARNRRCNGYRFVKIASQRATTPGPRRPKSLTQKVYGRRERSERSAGISSFPISTESFFHSTVAFFR